MMLGVDKPLMVSVVRDKVMYGKCIADNPYCSGCELLVLDNGVNNEFIPVLYNRVLDALNDGNPRWIVLCHEDFRPLEDVADLLARADQSHVYGPIGGLLTARRSWVPGGVWEGVAFGEIVESEKDGTGARTYGAKVPINTVVETVDCQCLIVHSTLVKKFDLRFDERLSFDLYTEDFCLGAFLNHGIQTAILPMKCQHFSRGKILPRFFEQKAYLDQKYPKAEAFGCVGYTIGGGRTVMRRLQKKIRAFLDRHARFLVGWYFMLIR